jgi:hypothetical protein
MEIGAARQVLAARSAERYKQPLPCLLPGSTVLYLHDPPNPHLALYPTTGALSGCVAVTDPKPSTLQPCHLQLCHWKLHVTAEYNVSLGILNTSLTWQLQN